MKRLKPIHFLVLLFSFSTFFIPGGFAQVSKIDRLSQWLSTEKKDSNKVTLLWQLAEQYQSFKPDTSLQLSQKALLLAQRIRFTEGESRSLAVLATSQYLLGDYPKALNNYMLKLRIEEKRNSPRNYASALSNIGITYILLGDYTNALEYLYRADSTVDAVRGKTRVELKYNIEVNLGEAYYRMKIPDSASAHFNNAFTLAKSSGDSASVGAAILGNANVLLLKNETKSALSYYRYAYDYLKRGSDADILCEVSLGMAKAYENIEENDSAVYFGKMSHSLAEKSKFLSRRLDAAFFLGGIYKKSRKYDSAFSYLEQSMQLNDSVKGQEKIKAAMILSINEKLRQEEIGEQKIRDKKARFQQLQLLTIAVCIPVLFLVTLFVSRKKINRRLVTFMGIMSLLFLFEFLTLLLHPVIADFTHHIPILELLIFVSIAALLVPAHHRLEHILISKLTKKPDESNDIRLTTKKMFLKKK
ncbi:MAG: tetratricopeptide repeat protein [Chitinophagaceae bacterium]